MTRSGCFILALAACGGTATSASTDTATQFTKTAAKSGRWNDARTWSPPGVPGDDATVLIPAGLAVTLTTIEGARLAVVDVAGTLQLSAQASTQLVVETLQVDMGGTFQIANPSHPLPPDLTARIVFADRGGAVEPTLDDPDAMRRGLIAMGAVRIYGAAKTPYVTLTENLAATAQTLPIARSPDNWRAGDHVVVPSTHFREVKRLQNEVATITAVHADHVDIDAALAFDHGVARDHGMALQVPDLERNVVFTSENADGHHRGHVMIMDCTDAVVQGALFLDLGRTDKKRVLNDPVWVDGVLQHGTGGNPRGRYPLHFHMCGLGQGTAVVSDSVVWGTPGWAAVNHSSRVDFTNDVAYDFDGAGFVAEDGDELGTFDGDMAIGGNGDVDAPLDERFVIRASYKNDDDRVAMADFGFHGDGFWLQSSSVVVTDDVAAGNFGQGFFYHTVGLHAFGPVWMPSAVVRDELGIDPAPLRHWLGADDPQGVVVQDLPIRKFAHNAAYGNFEGLKLRYTQGQSLNIFGQFDKATGLDLEDQVVPQDIADEVYAVSRVTDSQFWNNADGINISYTTNVQYDGVYIGSDEALSLGPPPRGACGLDKQVWVAWEGHDSSNMQTLVDITVQGYPIPILEQDADATVDENVTFQNEAHQVCGTVVDGELVTGITDYCYCDDKLVRK